MTQSNAAAHRSPTPCRRPTRAISRPARTLVVLSLISLALLWPARSHAQVTAVARPGATPAWDKGMQPVSSDSYYHAIECGKQSGDDPPCVFWDTGICRNADFTLTFYSGYKQVAYEVWTAVRKKLPAPQPNFAAAQRTRVIVAVGPAPGSKNTFTDLLLKRGGTAVANMGRSVSGGTGQFTFDYSAWAPTATVTLEMVGKTRTVACTITPDVLKQLR